MSVPLVLVAASGLAREVLGALGEEPSGFGIRGVLDDAPDLQGSTIGGVPVLGTIDAATEHVDAMFLVCAGRGTSRAAIVERLAALGVGDEHYATFVHPQVSVPPSCQIGCGSVLLAGSVLTTDVGVGRHVVVMPNVTLTHDDRVEDFATLCAGVTLGGNVRIGEAAYVGMSASVRQDVSVGRGATVGMGSVVLVDVSPSSTVAGVPAAQLTSGGRGLPVGSEPDS